MRTGLGLPLACLLLWSCGSATTPTEPATETVTATATATVTVTPSQERTSAPAPEPIGMGQSADVGQEFRFTVLDHASSEFAGEPNQGFLVEACATTKRTQTANAPWMAISASGGRYSVSQIVGDHVYSPPYPSPYEEEKATLEAGECFRGWMTFSTGEQIVELRYASDAGRATWTFS